MLGELLGAGASILGGIMGNKANEKANAANQATALRQEALQKEFAQSGIQWKVADAEKAGIHPLYALGANTISYSPSSVGATPNNFDFLGNAGQNIGRAIQAGSSNSRRMEALATTAQQIQLEGLQLDNELKRAQLTSAQRLASQPGTGPGMPNLLTRSDVAGQGDANSTDMITLNKKVSPQAGGNAQHLEIAASPDVSLYKTKRGYSPEIPQQLAESLESNPIGIAKWIVRNNLYHDYAISRKIPIRPGFRPRFSFLKGEYQYEPYRPYQIRRLLRRGINRKSW